MNKVVLIGNLCRDVSVSYNNDMCIAKYTLAVDRGNKKDGEQSADFINCVAFGKAGEFAQRYLAKGKKIAVEGRIQTGSYTNKDGNKVYTTDVIVDRHEFVESRNTSYEETPARNEMATEEIDSFMNVETDEEMPFA